MKIRNLLAVITPAVLCTAASLLAQTPVATKIGGFTFSAQKGQVLANVARLDGNARIKSPQLDVAADAIAFDFTGSQIKEVRARGSVQFKANLTPQGGGQPSHIEATCKSATLQSLTRTLVLEGNVNGFYQLPGGGRNTLSGSKATLKYDTAKNLIADLEGDAQGVKLVLPAENPNQPTAIGTVVVTAKRATLNTGTGEGQFTGNARAVSNDTANKFDVSAPAFLLSRGATGAMDTLKTTGRTTIKLDLPPDAAPDAGAATADATPNTAGTVPATPNKSVGKPTHLEVTADGATVKRADNTLVLEGDVRGFYELTNPGAQPTRQNFNGDRAIIKYVLPAQATADSPAGLQIEMTGKPVTIEAPQFDLGF